MTATLENALERTIELENYIAELERVVIGNLFGSSQSPQPRLNAGLAKETTRIISPLPKTDFDRSNIEADFPHIAEKLTLVWGYPDCFPYLTGLIIDNRGNRKGFNLDIMSDLMLLLKITEQVAPDKWAAYPGKHR